MMCSSFNSIFYVFHVCIKKKYITKILFSSSKGTSHLCDKKFANTEGKRKKVVVKIYMRNNYLNHKRYVHVKCFWYFSNQTPALNICLAIEGRYWNNCICIIKTANNYMIITTELFLKYSNSIPYIFVINCWNTAFKNYLIEMKLN